MEGLGPGCRQRDRAGALLNLWMQPAHVRIGLSRAIRPFGDICVEMLILGTGIDRAPPTAWCDQECGVEWKDWAQARILPWQTASLEAMRGSIFLRPDVARSFIAAWLG